MCDQQCVQASVIVVCTNELHHLQRCLPALLQQDYPAYEVLVVDNASTDGSPMYVREYSARYPHLRLVQNSANLGYVGANNVGFEHARGEFLVVLNPDTEPEHEWLSALLSPFVDPAVGLTTSKITMMYERDRLNTCGNAMSITGHVVCRGLGEPATAYAEQCDVAAVSGAAFALRRSLLEQIGGFDHNFFIYYEDSDLSLRARLAGFRCVYVPASVVAHDYIFKFSPKKAFWQERNRYYSLLKTFHWRTLALLAPWLLLGDLITLGYCMMQGREHVASKLRTYVWLVQHWREIMEARRRTQRLRAVPDAQLLRLLAPELRVTGAAEGWLRHVTEAGLRPILGAGLVVSRRISW